MTYLFFRSKYRGKTPFVGVFTYRLPELMILDHTLVSEILVGKFKHFHINYTNVRKTIFVSWKEEEKKLNQTFLLFEKLQYNKENARLFSRNPFILRDEEWKDNRADISPAFTTMKV